MLSPSIPQVLASSYHSPQLDVSVRLNTNESPLAPPEEFLRDVGSRIRTTGLNRYPDRAASQLRTRLGELYGTGPEAVFVGNGSNEVLQALFLAFGGPTRSAWVAPPTYGMYAQIANVTRTPVQVGGRDEELRIRSSDIGVDADIVVICDPNNPTGLVEPVALRDLPRSRPDQLFVVDRAYHEFDQRSVPEWSGSNVAVVRTFSKALSLAGLRLGFVIADPSVIEVLYGLILPYHLSALTQLVALCALDWREALLGSVQLVIDERQAMIPKLLDLGLHPYPSAANFILIEMGDYDAHVVWSALVEHSVLVRDASSWPGVENALRVTIGTRGENERFLLALEEVLG